MCAVMMELADLFIRLHGVTSQTELIFACEHECNGFMWMSQMKTMKMFYQVHSADSFRSASSFCSIVPDLPYMLQALIHDDDMKC